MKIDWYTLCYNEEFIIPWIVQYWEKIIHDGVDLHVYVYDNYSTDKSVEMLSKYPWITIAYFKTEGQNDLVQREIKSAAWKQSKGRADFVVVADFDEIIWGDSLVSELQYMKDNGYNVMGMKWYAFCGDEVPTYDSNKYLHQLVKKGYKQYINHTSRWGHLGKFMLFDPNKVDDMGYSVGCHISNPTPRLDLYESDKVVQFHINKGFSEDYFVNRRKIMADNLSEVNRRSGMCFEYWKEEQASRDEYRKYQEESIDISCL